MNYIKLLVLFCFCLFFFNSCTNVKDALQGKKSENSDEFLINKKNPLILPPNYDDLPEPKDSSSSEEENDSDIKEIIQVYQENEDDEDTSSSKSIEKFVLDNISKD